MCIPWLFSGSLKKWTFEERVAANDYSITSEVGGREVFFAKKIRAASLNCLNKAIAMIAVKMF